MNVRVALLTAPGRSALAALAVVGAGAWELLRPLARTMGGKELPASPEPGRFRLARLGAELSDEVVLAVRRPDWIEVHCHGGREVVRLLLDTLTARGATLVPWEDLEPDEALRLLPHAPTARTAAVLLDQHHGAFRRAVERFAAGDDAELRKLASLVGVGLHLTTPWCVAVAGAPNVGKSSLINALAGYQRSIVAATPGTTRDVVRVPIALDGWPVELLDTAGVREHAETLEAAGIEQAREQAAAADLCLWVLDATAPPLTGGDLPIPVLVVINKIDQPAAWDVAAMPGAVRVSALTGAGVQEVAAVIAAALVPEPPGPGDAVPITSAQARAVLDAAAALERGDRAAAVAALAGG